MVESKEDIQRLVRQELGLFKAVPTAAEELVPFLVDPNLIQLCWDYSEYEELRNCWVIARLPEELMIGFSKRGFGSPYFWGLIDSREASFGEDSSWFASLEDCFLQTRHWTGVLPEGYEVT